MAALARGFNRRIGDGRVLFLHARRDYRRADATACLSLCW